VASGYRIVALTVSTALFMQFLDSTALNVAIPAMSRDLGVPAIDLNVAILAYQLSMTVLIPVGSAICDRLGQRNAFVVALFVFMVGSVLCALSTSLPTLVAARALQGAGGDDRAALTCAPLPPRGGCWMGVISYRDRRSAERSPPANSGRAASRRRIGLEFGRDIVV
jgi:MFS family permease